MASSRQALANLLHEAGQIALQHYGTVRRERKGDGSIVTVADRACEAALVRGLSQHFPGARIVGEEGGVAPGPSLKRALQGIRRNMRIMRGLVISLISCANFPQ